MNILTERLRGLNLGGWFSQVDCIEEKDPADFTSLLKEADVGFSYWNYKNLDFGLVSICESLHKDLPQYNNDERLDRELLELLGRS